LEIARDDALSPAVLGSATSRGHHNGDGHSAIALAATADVRAVFHLLPQTTRTPRHRLPDRGARAKKAQFSARLVARH
jgi:hypothetical protein